MDHLAGCLEIGKYADLVMLEEGPLAIDPMAIKVMETWLERTRRYAA